MIVYKITNKINGKCYIGMTTNSLEKRITEHLSSSKGGSNFLLHCAIRKYGFQSFEFSIIDTSETKEILIEKEIYWIKTLNTKSPNGYNLTDGGEGAINPSIETRMKHSKWHKGKKDSEETRNRKIESAKKAKNIYRFKKGGVPWNKGLKGKTAPTKNRKRIIDKLGKIHYIKVDKIE
jgi:group I intron endonuclease